MGHFFNLNLFRRDNADCIKESLYSIMGKPVVENSTLAFRIYLTGIMYKQLKEDAGWGSED